MMVSSLRSLFNVKIAFLIITVLMSLDYVMMPDEPGAQGDELYYSTEWCKAQNGSAEQKLLDGSRCDCVTATHAVEVEWPRKWTEAIGQSLHYANMTGKYAGIVFIIYDLNELRFVIKAFSLIDRHNLPIKTWIVLVN